MDNGKELKEMITVPLRKALEKQGYKLIGSHSGVKLCRWTKVRIAVFYLKSIVTSCLQILLNCTKIKLDSECNLCGVGTFCQNSLQIL